MDREVPYECLKHLSHPDFGTRRRIADAHAPICKTCISRHMAARLETVGADGVGCPESGCNRTWGWYHVQQYLAPKLHDTFFEDAFLIFWSKAAKFSCPDPDCAAKNMLLEPRKTPGYPEIECYECKHRFCGLCCVRWHNGQTCQEYRAEHYEELLNDEDTSALSKLEALKARRCPRCQLVILKHGGCRLMTCDYCGKNFDWFRAERVRSILGLAVCVKNQNVQKDIEGKDVERGQSDGRESDDKSSLGTDSETDSNGDEDEPFLRTDHWSSEGCEVDMIAAGWEPRSARTPSAASENDSLF